MLVCGVLQGIKSAAEKPLQAQASQPPDKLHGSGPSSKSAQRVVDIELHWLVDPIVPVLRIAFRAGKH